MPINPTMMINPAMMMDPAMMMMPPPPPSYQHTSSTNMMRPNTYQHTSNDGSSVQPSAPPLQWSTMEPITSAPMSVASQGGRPVLRSSDGGSSGSGGGSMAMRRSFEAAAAMKATKRELRESQEDLRQGWRQLEVQQRKMQEQQRSLAEEQQRKMAEEQRRTQQQPLQRRSWEAPRRATPLSNSMERRRRQDEDEDESYGYGFKTTEEVRVSDENVRPSSLVRGGKGKGGGAEVVVVEPNKLDTANEELLRFSKMREEMMANFDR